MIRNQGCDRSELRKEFLFWFLWDANNLGVAIQIILSGDFSLKKIENKAGIDVKLSERKTNYIMKNILRMKNEKLPAKLML